MADGTRAVKRLHTMNKKDLLDANGGEEELGSWHWTKQIPCLHDNRLFTRALMLSQPAFPAAISHPAPAAQRALDDNKLPEGAPDEFIDPAQVGSPKAPLARALWRNSNLLVLLWKGRGGGASTFLHLLHQLSLAPHWGAAPQAGWQYKHGEFDAAMPTTTAAIPAPKHGLGVPTAGREEPREINHRKCGVLPVTVLRVLRACPFRRKQR